MKKKLLLEKNFSFVIKIKTKGAEEVKRVRLRNRMKSVKIKTILPTMIMATITIF